MKQGYTKVNDQTPLRREMTRLSQRLNEALETGDLHQIVEIGSAFMVHVLEVAWTEGRPFMPHTNANNLVDRLERAFGKTSQNVELVDHMMRRSCEIIQQKRREKTAWDHEVPIRLHTTTHDNAGMYNDVDHQQVLDLIGPIATGERSEYKEGTRDWSYHIKVGATLQDVIEAENRLIQAGYEVHR